MKKRCPKCLQPKNLDEFYPRKQAKDGRRSRCIACEIEDVLAYQARYPEQTARGKRRWYDANADDVRQRRRDRYWANREAELAYNAAYDEKNRVERRRKNTTRMRRIRKINPEQSHRWDRTHKVTRRALLLNAPVIEHFTLQEIAARDQWRCHLCQELVTRQTWSMDHLVPLSLGGEHSRANVALAHQLCNVKRGRRPLPPEVGLPEGGVA